ncbi:MAG: cupredoxin domain-containing protein [Burkholderiales bacterium]
MKKLFALLALTCLLPSPVLADTPEFALVIRDHRFQPAELRVPAGQKIKLVVHNQDNTPEEFESYELNREKIIAPDAKVHIFVGPLSAGRYPFFGDFNQKTARGALIAE